ncbi:WhiB family transcriptional regulator [Mycobacterium sp. NBC_00419]|uniref:WhiB family transcriptional regulator n=1 Tax=Mycobacterium sp. NBC_00419 TaxID=2975989 RepID=UPI002E1B5EDC
MAKPSRSNPRPLAQPFVREWEWQSAGNCVGHPVEVFFPEDSPRRDRRRLEQQAKNICWGCPIKVQCLEHAINTPEQFGVWGATTASERGQRITATTRSAEGSPRSARGLGYAVGGRLAQ